MILFERVSYLLKKNPFISSPSSLFGIRYNASRSISFFVILCSELCIWNVSIVFCIPHILTYTLIVHSIHSSLNGRLLYKSLNQRHGLHRRSFPNVVLVPFYRFIIFRMKWTIKRVWPLDRILKYSSRPTAIRKTTTALQ